MKILKLQAENFKKLKAIEINPVGNVIEITGKCEAGKTSILDAIMTALCGAKWDEPIREGQEKGFIKVDLGDMIVTRTLTKSGGALKVETRDGAKYPSPQALLDKLVSKITFNPLEFSREKDSKKQVDMLLKVVDIKIDSVKLQEISGVKVTEIANPLEMFNSAWKTIYDNRTLTNRQLDAAKKTLDSLPEVAKVEPVSLAELVTEKEKLQKVIDDNKEVVKRRDMALADKQETIARMDAANEAIIKLEQQLIEARKNFAELSKELDGANAVLADWEIKVSNLVDPDLTEINERIKTADETNKKAQQYKTRQEKSAEVDKFQAESDDYTARIKKIIDYKTEIISQTKFPVPGLGFANGGVTFEGKPFSQASSAQKIRVGMGVGMAGNPELRVVMIDGYESLDSDQRKIVEEMATEHDFQIWCTSVNDDATVGIYIDDGEIKSASGRKVS